MVRRMNRRPSDRSRTGSRRMPGMRCRGRKHWPTRAPSRTSPPGPSAGSMPGTSLDLAIPRRSETRRTRARTPSRSVRATPRCSSTRRCTCPSRRGAALWLGPSLQGGARVLRHPRLVPRRMRAPPLPPERRARVGVRPRLTSRPCSKALRAAGPAPRPRVREHVLSTAGWYRKPPGDKRLRRRRLDGSVTLGQRRAAARHRVARKDRAHRHLEGAGPGPSPRRAAQPRRRRAGRSRRPRRRAARGLRLPDRVVSILGGAAGPPRFHPRAVRRELHHRGTCRTTRSASATATGSGRLCSR